MQVEPSKTQRTISIANINRIADKSVAAYLCAMSLLCCLSHSVLPWLLTLPLSFLLLCTLCTKMNPVCILWQLVLFAIAWVTLQQPLALRTLREEQTLQDVLYSFLFITFITAAWTHAWLKILGIWAGHTEVQLSFKHSLPHPLALFTGRGAASRPWGPVWIYAGLRGII